jgi:hypothetical protein
MAKNVNAKTWALEPDANGDRWSAGQAEANLPPVWSGAPTSLSVRAGSLVNFYQWASDPNGNALTYSLRQTPAGYSISSAGVLTVGPGNGTVVVRATDPGGLFADTSCTVTVLSASASVKWNPGTYIYLSPSSGHKDGAAQRASDLQFMQDNASNPNIKGYYIQKRLYFFEAAQGVYDKVFTTSGVNYGGYAMVDWYLQQCRTYGNKRLMIEFEGTAFGTNVTQVVPPYWEAAGWVDYPSGYTGAKIWIADCMTRFLAMLQAYGTRYNSEPLVEIIGIEETSYPVPSDQRSNWLTQMVRWVQTVPTYWLNTLTRYNANFTPTESQQITLLNAVKAMNEAGTGALICGGPDPQGGYPTNIDLTHVYFRGETAPSGLSTGYDLRGHTPWINCTEENYLITNTIRTPAWIYDFAIDVQRSSHMSWLSYVRWPEVLAEINARSGATVSTVPSTLSGRTVTGGF